MNFQEWPYQYLYQYFRKVLIYQYIDILNTPTSICDGIISRGRRGLCAENAKNTKTRQTKTLVSQIVQIIHMTRLGWHYVGEQSQGFPKIVYHMGVGMIYL